MDQGNALPGILQLHRHAFKAMGSPCEIQIYVESEAQAQRISDLVVADVERLEARYSRYRPQSLLSGINRVAAEGGASEVDEETAGLLNYADTCYRESGGLFDITSGILRKAWRFDQTGLPERSLIKSLLDRIGWKKVRWSARKLEFTVTGMELDFGGIVKEYAVDRQAALCWENGIRHGVINLGGDIKIIGPHPDGSPWRIGIQHPRADRGESIRTISLTHGAMASSGDYERCIVLDGKRYGHILNPKTGWPVSHLASVSVVADFCVVAGSTSTIAMLKEKAGPGWLKSMGLPHFWVDLRGKTGGWAG